MALERVASPTHPGLRLAEKSLLSGKMNWWSALLPPASDQFAIKTRLEDLALSPIGHCESFSSPITIERKANRMQKRVQHVRNAIHSLKHTNHNNKRRFTADIRASTRFLQVERIHGGCNQAWYDRKWHKDKQDDDISTRNRCGCDVTVANGRNGAVFDRLHSVTPVLPINRTYITTKYKESVTDKNR